MSSDQILLRIHHYHYNVRFGTTDLMPLAKEIVIAAERKFYDGHLFDNSSVNEDIFLCRGELKIRVTTKYIATAVPLLQRITDGNLLPEEELQLLPRHPQGITLKFPRARLTGSDQWQLNTAEDQAVTLEFIARAGSDGKVVNFS